MSSSDDGGVSTWYAGRHATSTANSTRTQKLARISGNGRPVAIAAANRGEADQSRNDERDVHDAGERLEHHERTRHGLDRHDVAQPDAREHHHAEVQQLRPGAGRLRVSEAEAAWHDRLAHDEGVR